MTAARQERKLCRGFATIAAVMGLLAALAGPVAFAAATTERGVVNRHTGLAIDGFDPVALNSNCLSPA